MNENGSGFKGFSKPNTVDVPTEWLLKYMPEIKKLGVAKVVSYIIYKTMAFNKWVDWISRSQFEHGRSDDPNDNGCGLSGPTVDEALAEAAEAGYIISKLFCPHCQNEVFKTEIENRPWRNKNKSGVKDVAVVPTSCPNCGKYLRGGEHGVYRLAFADEIVAQYEKPTAYWKKYNYGKEKKVAEEATAYRVVPVKE